MALVARQTVKIGTVEAGKRFQPVQCACGFKGLGIQLHRSVRGVTTGAACGVLFQVGRVRGAVCTQEKFRAVAHCRLDQRQAVLLALEYGQAVVVRTNPACKNRVAVVQQMMRGDGRCRESVCVAHIMRSLLGGDVLKNDFEFGEITAQRNQLGVNKHRFTVEQVNVRAGDFAMHQQQQASLLHGFQRFISLAQVGYAGVAVGGGTGRVQLGGDHASVFGPLDLVGRQVVGQVKRHQRLKRHPIWYSRLNTAFISHSKRCSSYRWAQVGHDDGAAKLGRRVRHHGMQCVPVAHMQVPVIGPGDFQGRDRSGWFKRHRLNCRIAML